MKEVYRDIRIIVSRRDGIARTKTLVDIVGKLLVPSVAITVVVEARSSDFHESG